MREQPKRILHVVRAMNCGGVETWLMHALRHMNPSRVRMDFLVHCAGEYDEEIRTLGGRLIPCSHPLWSPAYRRSVGAAVRQFGPYDVFHSHVHHFSGYLLHLARRFGVPVRIAHSHSDTSRIDRSAGWTRRCYLRAVDRAIQANATCLAAVSRPAARALFGEGWQADSRSRLVYCGIDLAPFRPAVDRRAVRAMWRIGESELVIGHVGRFVPQKNHSLLIQVAAELMGRRPGTRLLLVGDGPLRGPIQEQARDLGIADRVGFAGSRGDVPQLLGAMDVLLFPSECEGLPLAVLEAQAAGLPCVISDVITDEADVVPELIRRVPLAQEAKQWAAAVLGAGERPVVSPGEAFRRVEQSSFNISNSIDQLYALYDA
ncbi:MAG TPA: glycosyltransferase [Bryobacteraceae bacterium]|nr:glycosyltransferase [Bryobacteraceae bacterium]